MNCRIVPYHLYLAAIATALAATGCTPAVREDTELADRMLTEVVEIYGPPQSDRIITPAEGLKAYQSGIRRHFPTTMLEQILVREVQWQRGDERTIVWFKNMTGTWRAFSRRVERIAE